MRVTSSLWVSALIRRAEAAGAFAMVLHRGAAEAGAIFIVVNNMSDRIALYGPAPQTDYSMDGPSERQFECVLDEASDDDLKQKIAREKSFDPDIWVVEIEDRQGRSFIESG